ncbi:MAG: aminoacyl-tRNA hydrolase [Deltaproteobacteria bacterium]|nr:aminoacyl-tRNA hydrolase [Deltaproteobacteria bacterium]
MSKRLIVGLGNPGPQYAFTRHNLGFMVVEELSRRWRIPLNRQTLTARWGQGRAGDTPVILAEPLTYMNLSGKAVSGLLRYFRLTPERLVVIHDDLDVPLGRLKIMEGGGPGGHRGVASIIGALGAEEFIRVKLGIGRPPAEMLSEDFVLSPFAKEEEEMAAALVERGAEAVVALLKEGLAAAQNRFHGRGKEEK